MTHDLPRVIQGFRDSSQDLAADIIGQIYRFRTGAIYDVQDAETAFNELLSAGSTVTRKSRKIQLVDGASIFFSSKTAEGMLAETSTVINTAPRLRINVTNTGSEADYIVEDLDGYPESYTKTEDSFEKLATYVDESQIERDESGKIWAIRGDTKAAERTVIEMERSVGFRAVRSEIIDVVHPIVQQIQDYVQLND